MGEAIRRPEFTAIIPVYNGEKFIARSIESILSQSVRPEQIIVVNDGSTDNTAAVIEKYVVDGVECVYQKNGGLASARNAGIKAASGRYLGFLDADDEWKECLVSDVKEIFDANPDLVWATTPYVKLFESGEVEFVRSVGSDLSSSGVIEDYFTAEAQFNFACSSNMFVKREVFDRIGSFDTSISQYGEDNDMWFRIALMNPRIGYGHRVGAIYWGRTGSLMDTDPRDVAHQLTQIQKSEAQSLSMGGHVIERSEPLVLAWVWMQIKEAAIQGDKKALRYISRYYGRRFPLRRRLMLSLFRLVPFRHPWVVARKLASLRH